MSQAARKRLGAVRRTSTRSGRSSHGQELLPLGQRHEFAFPWTRVICAVLFPTRFVTRVGRTGGKRGCSGRWRSRAGSAGDRHLRGLSPGAPSPPHTVCGSCRGKLRRNEPRGSGLFRRLSSRPGDTSRDLLYLSENSSPGSHRPPAPREREGETGTKPGRQRERTPRGTKAVTTVLPQRIPSPEFRRPVPEAGAALQPPGQGVPSPTRCPGFQAQAPFLPCPPPSPPQRC